ncbi:MAG TPA: hypothetical protein VFG84_12465 [Gemmatimonadaceae bacterium]|jgi:hypothetical protein|nr:hypothetical protein [Gemmatimonadaceae bacterium]
MDEKQLAKLIRKNSAKAEQRQQGRKARAYDHTAPVRESTEDDKERDAIFKEMKKREF